MVKSERHARPLVSTSRGLNVHPLAAALHHAPSADGCKRSLCENVTLAAVAALQINDLRVLRTVFSHRLSAFWAARSLLKSRRVRRVTRRLQFLEQVSRQFLDPLLEWDVDEAGDVAGKLDGLLVEDGYASSAKPG